MNRQHSIIDHIAEFLAGQEFRMFRSEEGASFFGSVTTNEGVDLSLRVTCARNPSLVHVVATLPIAVPQSRHGSVVRALNFINQGVPCGGLALDPDDGRVSLTNSAMIPDDDHPGGQLGWLLSINAAVMHRHALTLVRLAAGALGVRTAIALLTRESASPAIPAPPDPDRFRWN